MGMIDPIVDEFSHESRSTRKVLERIPEEALAWKPHEKSMSMAHLASHIAEIPNWVTVVTDQDEFSMDPDTYKPWVAGTKAEILEKFDKYVVEAIEAMRRLPDDRLMKTWTMVVKGHPALSMPRIAVLRVFVLNHTVHHRGQLEVYLRLHDVPLPQIYGPTADEPETPRK